MRLWSLCSVDGHGLVVIKEEWDLLSYYTDMIGAQKKEVIVNFNTCMFVEGNVCMYARERLLTGNELLFKADNIF